MGNMMGFKDGDNIVANFAVRCPEDGTLANSGRIFTIKPWLGRLMATSDEHGLEIYVYKKGVYDITGQFRLVKEKQELTVAQIEEKLGYGVKIVK
jgi:hypothetical protein